MGKGRLASSGMYGSHLLLYCAWKATSNMKIHFHLSIQHVWDVMWYFSPCRTLRGRWHIKVCWRTTHNLITTDWFLYYVRQKVKRAMALLTESSNHDRVHNIRIYDSCQTLLAKILALPLEQARGLHYNANNIFWQKIWPNYVSCLCCPTSLWQFQKHRGRGDLIFSLIFWSRFIFVHGRANSTQYTRRKCFCYVTTFI